MHNDLIFSYGVSVERYTEKPTKKPFFWTEKQGTVNDLLNDILRGHAYCSIFYHGAKETQEIEQSRKEKASRDGKQYASLNIKQNEFTTYSHTAKYFKQTNIISFDFDKCDTTAYKCFELLQATEITPTFIYTSSSNGTIIDGKRNNAYRLVYIIDQPIANGEQYTAIHGHLKTEILKTVNDRTIYNDPSDTNGKAERCYYGNGSENVKYYPNGYNFKVYSLTWLVDRYNVVITETPVNDSYVSFVPAMVEATAYDTTHDPDTLPSSEQTAKRVKTTEWVDYQKKKKVVFNGIYSFDPSANGNIWQEFFNDYNDPSTTFSRLTFNYRGRLPLLPTATDIQPYLNDSNKDKLYIEVDSDYTELVYKRVKAAKRDKNGQKVERWENARFYDGMGRRRKIFIHCLLLRLITPTATRVQILWGAVNFMVEYIDNKQDPITKREVSRIVDDVMGKDLQDWQELKQHYQRKFKVNKAVAAAKGVPPRQAALKAQQERATDAKTVKWQTIAKHYDPAKTDKENLKALALNGLKIAPAYLQAWKSANGYTKQRKASRAEMIAAYYDPQLTDGQNLEQLATNGVNVSLKTLKRWKSANAYTKQRAKTPQEPNRAVEGVFNAVVEDSPNEQTRCKQGANVGYFPSLDIEDLANEFLSGGTAKRESVKPSKTCKDFDPWAFYCSHNPEGVKYGRDVIKDREQAAKIGQEMETSGIDYSSMTDDEFWQMICSECEQETATANGVETIEDDEPF